MLATSTLQESMAYEPRGPGILCPCGRPLGLPSQKLVEPDTVEGRGAMWQAACRCGRTYTVEVGGDPEHPRSPPPSRLRQRRGRSGDPP